MIEQVEAVGAGKTCTGEDRWWKGDVKGAGAYAHKEDRREKFRCIHWPTHGHIL
jgi:hypothetical protein